MLKKEMDFKADFERVPVVDLNRNNLQFHLPQLLKGIKEASFIALDCELSGLGDRKKLNASTIDDRYKNTALVAKTRSIISLGISVFELHPDAENDPHVNKWSYKVNTYNLLLLCGEDYIVEPGSLKFLVDHGFDFQAQYSSGIHYLRGNDRPEVKIEAEPARLLFSELVSAGKPVVLHNGLIDLVFLYHNFWAALPLSLSTFVADLGQMFPAGIYDSKYIADFVARTQASFLEYVFRKEQKANIDKCFKNRPHVRLGFSPPESDVQWRLCGMPEPEEDDSIELCESYANHGHCPKGSSCENSHNIDRIVDQKIIEQDKKRRKKNTDNDFTSLQHTNGKKKEKKNKENSGGHRAGYDAFMTGFSFATFLVHQTKIPVEPVNYLAGSLSTENLVNRIYLVSKDFPLLIQKSSFSKCSAQHDDKMKTLGLLNS